MNFYEWRLVWRAIRQRVVGEFWANRPLARSIEVREAGRDRCMGVVGGALKPLSSQLTQGLR